MEDLRRNKEEQPNMGVPSMDMGAMPNTVGGKVSTSYTNHLPKFIIPKKVKKFLYYTVFIAAIASICIFPYEIGDTIGYWMYNFWTGLTHRF
jgi:hypothetical protein